MRILLPRVCLVALTVTALWLSALLCWPNPQPKLSRETLPYDLLTSLQDYAWKDVATKWPNQVLFGSEAVAPKTLQRSLTVHCAKPSWAGEDYDLALALLRGVIERASEETVFYPRYAAMKAAKSRGRWEISGNTDYGSWWFVAGKRHGDYAAIYWRHSSGKCGTGSFRVGLMIRLSNDRWLPVFIMIY
jgi:hypothetical protein